MGKIEPRIHKTAMSYNHTPDTKLTIEQILELTNIKEAISSSTHTVFILRGLPGCGKSTVANKIKNMYADMVEICSADSFFIDQHGNYRFSPDRLPEVHQRCKEKVTQTLSQTQEKRIVIIDNTHSTYKEYNHYTSLPTIILEFAVTKQDVDMCAARSIHSVPLYAVQRMFDRWESDPNAILMPILK